MKEGTLKGRKIEKRQFLKALETYYGMMGWGVETGVSKKEKLAELYLGWLSSRE
jgi:aldehyde:ferredoxin oxidoreductase